MAVLKPKGTFIQNVSTVMYLDHKNKGLSTSAVALRDAAPLLHVVSPLTGNKCPYLTSLTMYVVSKYLQTFTHQEWPLPAPVQGYTHNNNNPRTTHLPCSHAQAQNTKDPIRTQISAIPRPYKQN
jgi:hypothetical protein